MKRYCALFTCVASRAVHIEVTIVLDTDSFIQALRRFIARQGPVRLITLDNGTNLVEAANELRKALDEMNHEQVKHYLRKNGSDCITWENNSPAVSDIERVWEHQIGPARTILDVFLKTHSCSLNEENFRTLLAETEAIINYIPLLAETLSDVNSQIPLSSSNLLTQKTSVVLPPPGNFDKPDLYSRRKWTKIQHIAGEFWSRWRNQFLQNLRIQQKWNTKKQGFQVSDIVLLREDLGRDKWPPMVKVVKIEPDSNVAVRSVELRTVDLLNNQKLLRRTISKIELLVENEMVRFPTEETNKGQDDMIT